MTDRDREEPRPNVTDEQGRTINPPENNDAGDNVEQQEERYYRETLRSLNAENRGVKYWSREFLSEWTQNFNIYLNTNEAGVIHALYSVDAFEDFVLQTRDELMSQENVTQDQLDNNPRLKERFQKKLSSTIERKIVIAISGFYFKVDKMYSNETFEQIEQTNFMKSMRLGYEIVQQRLNLLQSKFGELERTERLPEGLREITFFKKYSAIETSRKKIKRADGSYKDEFTSRPIPTARDIPTELSKFLLYISAQTQHFVDFRRYLHNITILFKQGGGGDHGFWEGVANYAKQISTTDIDSIMLLPDNELFMTAHNLYIKHLTLALAKHSWIHQSEMFSTDFFDPNTDIEKRVLEDLRSIFPEIADLEEIRIQRAVKMGVGIARGVTLAEVEIAASADPTANFVDDQHHVSYESYYISDSAPLLAFRPTMNGERFLPPDLMKGPLWHMPVDHFKKSKIWRFRGLLKKMHEFQKTYVEGKTAFTKDPGATLLIDAMSNFARVGSIDSRSGWRYPRGYEAWLRTILNEHGENEGKYNYLESWKQLENIGFVVLRNFVKNYIIDHADGKRFLEGERSGGKAERDAFFEYLYEKYIKDDPISGFPSRTFQEEFNNTRTFLENREKTEEGTRNPKISDREVYEYLLHRALFGVLRQRAPTLFVKLDRDRFSDKGEDAYKLILKSLEASNSNFDEKRLDRAFRNLGNIEARLRLDISEQMKKYLGNHQDTKDLADPNITYRVTEEYIRQFLQRSNASETDIQDTIILFKHIHKNFLNNDSKFAQDRMYMFYKNQFQYTVGLEELDTSFLAYRAAGDTVLYRALNDISLIERDVATPTMEIIKLLGEAAKSHDISPIIERLSLIREKISVLHGDKFAWEQTSKLVGMVINYFRKDTMAKGLLGLFKIGVPTSLSELFAGATRGIMQWESKEINMFFLECERNRILPKYASEFRGAPQIKKRSKFLKKLGFKDKLTYKYDSNIMTGKEGRKLFGATYGSMAREYLLKYGPLFIFIIIALMLKKAFDEEVKEKQ